MEGKEDTVQANNSKETPGERKIEQFMQQLRKEENWNCSLKLLYIAHKLIHTMRLNFTIDFAKQDLFQDIKVSLRIAQQRDEVFVPIVLKYYSFLRSVSVHYKEVYECEQYFQTENITYLDAKSLEEIINTMRPLINILKNVFRAEQNLSFALQNFPKYEIVKEVVLLLIKETIVIFDFLSYLMRRIESNKSYFSFKLNMLNGLNILKIDVILSEKDTENSLLVYGIYEEVIVLSKNMEKMYSLRNLTSDIFLQRPKFFIVDKEHNKQIELHVNAIHKRINNTDNVTATVTKSVNESSSQIIEASQKEATQINEQHTRSSRVNSKCNESTELAIFPKSSGNKQKSQTKMTLKKQNEETVPFGLQKEHSQQATSSDTLNYKASGCQFKENNLNQAEFVENSSNNSSEDELESDLANNDDDRAVIINNLCTKKEKIKPAIIQIQQASKNSKSNNILPKNDLQEVFEDQNQGNLLCDETRPEKNDQNIRLDFNQLK